MKVIAIFFTLLLSLAPANAYTSTKFNAGSREAAIQMTTDWLQGFYKKPTEPVTRTEVLQSSDASMTIKSSFQGLACTLNMKKYLNVNKFGWVVEKHVCTKEA